MAGTYTYSIFLPYGTTTEGGDGASSPSPTPSYSPEPVADSIEGAVLPSEQPASGGCCSACGSTIQPGGGPLPTTTTQGVEGSAWADTPLPNLDDPIIPTGSFEPVTDESGQIVTGADGGGSGTSAPCCSQLRTFLLSEAVSGVPWWVVLVVAAILLYRRG